MFHLKKDRRPFFRLLGIISGSLVDAFGYSAFLVPNKLNLGGIAGIATILYHLIGLPVGFLYVILNVPIFILALFRLDRRILLRTGLTLLINAFAMDLFMRILNYAPITNDLLLAAIYGGVLSGIGIGLVFRSRGSLGGTDLLAQVIFSYTHFSFGQIVFFVDASVILAAAIIFRNAQLALLPLLALFILGKVIDTVQEGFSAAKAGLIVTNEEEKLQSFIINTMGRGITILDGYGGYTKEGRKVLLCAFSRSQISSFKENVKAIDPDAFIMIGSLDEVLGEGFENGF
jgi:uncharacterized membrane-anchored protein YitT (DUF2179 family)